MFKFKAPGSEGFRNALRQARLVVGARQELQEQSRELVMEFTDVADLRKAVDQRVENQAQGQELG